MRIAVGLPQVGSDVGACLTAAQEAEAAGAWGVWVYDNLAPLVRPERPSLEGWMLLGPLARATRRIRLVSLVTRAGLRYPPLVARMSAVVQDASAGRFVLGLGAGDRDSLAEERRFGINVSARRADRLGAMTETILRVRYEPMPVRPVVEPAPIWVGGARKDLLRLAADHADAWHGWGLDAERFARAAAQVRELADRPIECWWGGMFRPDTADKTMDDLRDAGADGITWMITSTREGADRPALLDRVRAAAGDR